MGRSLRIARLFDIPIAINITWPFIFAVVAWSLAESYLPGRYDGWNAPALWSSAVLATLLLFASVLAHELAHALTARRFGLGVDGIDLFIFGGVARLETEPESPVGELVMAAAGPACSLALAAIGAATFLLADRLLGPAPLTVLLEHFVLTNLALGLFNLAPGFPLDGGRMLRAALWRLRGDRRGATAAAAGLGQLLGAGLVLWGTYSGTAALFSATRPFGPSLSGLLLVLTGWFLIEAARSAYRTTLQQEESARLRLGDLARSGEVPFVAADLPIERLVRDYVLGREFAHYPVVDGNAIIGVVTVDQVGCIARERWAETPVRSLLAPLDAGQVAGPGDRAVDALGRMVRDGLNKLLVVDRGRVVGVITRHQLLTALGRD